MIFRSTSKSSQKWKEGGKEGLAFAEQFETAGETAEVDSLLEFEAKGGGGGFHFEWVDPDHSSTWPQGDGGDSEKFIEQATKVGNGNPFS